MVARSLAASKPKNVSGLPGLRKTITEYLCKPKGDELHLQHSGATSSITGMKSTPGKVLVDAEYAEHDLVLLTVESSPTNISEMVLDPDSDVNLEAPVLSVSTDWADAVDSISEGVSDSDSGATDDSWVMVVSQVQPNWPKQMLFLVTMVLMTLLSHIHSRKSPHLQRYTRNQQDQEVVMQLHLGVDLSMGVFPLLVVLKCSTRQ